MSQLLTSGPAKAQALNILWRALEAFIFAKASKVQRIGIEQHFAALRAHSGPLEVEVQFRTSDLTGAVELRVVLTPKVLP